MTLTLPPALLASAPLDSLHLRGHADACRIDGLSRNECEIGITSGDVRVTQLKARNLTFSGVSGSTRIQGAIDRRVRMRTISGDVVVTLTGAAPSTISCGIVSGMAKLELPESTGFTARVQAVSGAFHSDFDLVTENSGDLRAGDGAVSIDADIISGTLNINKIPVESAS